MSKMKPVCVFCHKSTSKLKSFEKPNLSKCCEILTIKKSNNLAGKEVVLPVQPNDIQLYHSNCYRRFTALPPKYRKAKSTAESSSLTAASSCSTETSSTLAEQPVVQDESSRSEEIIKNINTRNNSPPCENIDTGLNRDPESVENSDFAAEVKSVLKGTGEDENMICFFCKKKRKKVKGREEKLSLFLRSGLHSIQKLANETDDLQMVQNVEELLDDKEYCYHKYCKNVYIASRNSALSKNAEKSEWHFTRDIRAEAYDFVENFVSDNIIKNEQSYFLIFLNDMFINYLQSNDQDVANYTLKPYHLRDRLLKKFTKKVNIIKFKGQSIVKPYRGILVQNEVEKYNILDAAATLGTSLKSLTNNKQVVNIINRGSGARKPCRKRRLDEDNELSKQKRDKSDSEINNSDKDGDVTNRFEFVNVAPIEEVLIKEEPLEDIIIKEELVDESTEENIFKDECIAGPSEQIVIKKERIDGPSEQIVVKEEHIDDYPNVSTVYDHLQLEIKSEVDKEKFQIPDQSS